MTVTVAAKIGRQMTKMRNGLEELQPQMTKRKTKTKTNMKKWFGRASAEDDLLDKLFNRAIGQSIYLLRGRVLTAHFIFSGGLPSQLTSETVSPLSLSL